MCQSSYVNLKQLVALFGLCSTRERFIDSPFLQLLPQNTFTEVFQCNQIHILIFNSLLITVNCDDLDTILILEQHHISTELMQDWQIQIRDRKFSAGVSDYARRLQISLTTYECSKSSRTMCNTYNKSLKVTMVKEAVEINWSQKWIVPQKTLLQYSCKSFNHKQKINEIITFQDKPLIEDNRKCLSGGQ